MKILLTEHQFKILTEKLILEAAEPWKQENSGMDIDYYEKLGIDKSATKDQIKKAYRKLALKAHPDNNPDNKEGAETEFKKINSINQILNDDKLRKKYDEWHDIVLPLIKQKRQQQQPKQEPPKTKQQQQEPKPKQEPPKPKPKTEPKQQQQQQQQNAKKADTAIYTGGGGSKGSQQGTSVYTGGGSKGSQQGSSSSNTNNNTNNSGNNSTTGQQSTSSGGGSGGGGTGNTGGRSRRRGKGRGTTGNTQTTSTGNQIDDYSFLKDSENLKKSFYQAPNLLDIFTNLLRGRKAFDGKGYIKAEDTINKLKSYLTSMMNILPNLYKYFKSDSKGILSFKPEENIKFNGNNNKNVTLDKNTNYKFRVKGITSQYIKFEHIDTTNNIVIYFLITNEVDVNNNIVRVGKAYFNETILPGNTSKAVYSDPKIFDITLISKAGSGFFKQ
jgi:curved DNA-binding protein CbpA